MDAQEDKVEEPRIDISIRVLRDAVEAAEADVVWYTQQLAVKEQLASVMRKILEELEEEHARVELDATDEAIRSMVEGKQ
jgi:transcription initiation factor IIE alpha subunit